MGMSRRRLLKAGAIASVGGMLLGRESLAKRKKKKKKKDRKASNGGGGGRSTGANSLVRFPGTDVTYEPFTQTFALPDIMGFGTSDIRQALDPADGKVLPTPNDPGQEHALTPAPGAPDARVGSEAVHHGIAPEYARSNPTHYVGNQNDFEDPPPVQPGECQHLTKAYPWDRFDHPEDPSARNEEPWDRTDPTDRAGEVHYWMELRNSRHEWAPGVVTDILAYRDARHGTLGDAPPEDPVPVDPENPDSPRVSPTGEFPAPTFIARQGQPTVVRVTNNIQFRPPQGSGPAPTEASVHLHGDHTPAHSDGYPDFYILPEKSRDYYYPNIGPRDSAEPVTEEGLSPIEIAEKGNQGPYSLSDLPTTMWYHEHGMDITGYLVSQGLAGFYLIQDDHEIELTKEREDGTRLLPELYAGQDIPMALMDQIIDLKEEILPYDFLDHNGRLGNVFSVNGKLQPYFEVGRGKYRFRFLNASNARIYHLALEADKGNRSRVDKVNFLQIGQDSWELERAVEQSDFTLTMAQRSDMIVDFSDFEDGDVVWLNNVMEQQNGRKPKGVDFEDPTPLVKFIVKDDIPVDKNITVEAGDLIRCFTEIREDELLATRYFEFHRRNGAWQINSQFFSPRTTNVTPILNSAERWVFRNKSGGWWHPIHIPLEAHEIQKYNGIPKRRRNGEINPKFPAKYLNNVDVSVLEDGGETEFFIKCRTFTGPFVFHCHNLEHEDMRMMHAFDPRPAGEPSLNDGNRPHNSEFSADGVSTYRQVSGMVLNENRDDVVPPGFGPVFFDEYGDVERLDGREVGFPESNVDFPQPPVGQIDPGPPGPDAPDSHDD